MAGTTSSPLSFGKRSHTPWRVGCLQAPLHASSETCCSPVRSFNAPGTSNLFGEAAPFLSPYYTSFTG